LNLQLHMQSVSINNKILGSNPAHDEVYSIHHNAIKFVCNLRQIGFFSQYFY
jgi:hypothetical protein